MTGRRSRTPREELGGGGVSTCACGSTWFELLAAPESGLRAGVFTFDNDGQVTGYAGEPHCIECGARWVPTRQRLTVVD